MLLDVRLAPAWTAGLQELEVVQGQPGEPGCVGHAHYVEQGRRHTLVDVLEHVTPNRRYRSRVSGGGLTARIETVLEPIGNGTRLSLRWDGQGTTPAVRMLLPLLRRRIARRAAADLRALAALARGGGQAGGVDVLSFDLSVNIATSAAAVFAFVCDVQEHTVSPGSPVIEMEKVPLGPTRPGTRWREVVALGPLTRMTVWSEVTAIKPDTRLEMRFWGPGMRGFLAYAIEPGDEGIVLRHREWLQLAGPLRFLKRWIRAALTAQLRSRLQDIRTRLEHRK